MRRPPPPGRGTIVQRVVVKPPPLAHVSTCSQRARNSIGLTGRGAAVRRQRGAKSAAAASGSSTIPALNGSASGGHAIAGVERDLPAEGRAPGDHLVSDDAERPDVPRGADVVAGHLLRRHVVERADQQPGAGASVDGRLRPSLGGTPWRARSRAPSGTTPLAWRCRKMFSGFRSRWTRPWACAAVSAEHTPRRICSASAALSGTPLASRWRSVSPSSSSMTRNGAAIAVDAEVVDADHVRMREAGGRSRLLRNPEPGVAADRAGRPCLP